MLLSDMINIIIFDIMKQIAQTVPIHSEKLYADVITEIGP